MTDEQNPYTLPFEQFEEWLKGMQRARALRPLTVERPAKKPRPPGVRARPQMDALQSPGSKWTRYAVAWRQSGWVAQPDVAYGPGVYVLYADAQLVYVGMSDRVNVRVGSHMANGAAAPSRALGRTVRSWVVKYRPERFYGERATLELRLIRRLKPCLNRTGNGRKRGDSELPPVNMNDYRLVRRETA